MPIEEYPGAPVCTCSQVDAEALEGRVWGEVCKLLGDPARLKAMAEGWVGLATKGGIDYDARTDDLQQQIDAQDAAISAAVVMAVKERDLKTAMEQAVTQLKEERRELVEMLAEVEAWKAESETVGQRAQNLEKLAEMARERPREMKPTEQAEVLALLDIKVTLKGEIPRKARKDDQLVGWFHQRNRLVPVLDDDAWEKAKVVLTQAGRVTPTYRSVLAGLLHKARTGVAWDAIPAEFGNWHSICSRYQRWVKAGTWDLLLDALADVEGIALSSPLPALAVESRVDLGMEPEGADSKERRVDGP